MLFDKSNTTFSVILKLILSYIFLIIILFTILNYGKQHTNTLLIIYTIISVLFSFIGFSVLYLILGLSIASKEGQKKKNNILILLLSILINLVIGVGIGHFFGGDHKIFVITNLILAPLTTIGVSTLLIQIL